MKTGQVLTPGIVLAEIGRLAKNRYDNQVCLDHQRSRI
jgi:hypothetical protein